MTSPIRGGGGTYYPQNQPIYQAGYHHPSILLNQPAYYPRQPQNQAFCAPNNPMNQAYNTQAQGRVPFQDPDEAFKVNSNPPPYSEVVKEQKP